MLEKLLASLERYWTLFVVSLPRLGLALIIVIAGIFIAGWISKFTSKRLEAQSHDPLMGRFLGKTLRVVLIVAIVMLGLHAAGLSGIAGAILATAGASAIVIGFAFKDIAENFIAGVILAFNRPFHIDDTIQIDQTFGKVKDMQFRYTQIKTFDGRDVYIPNSDILKKPVVNFTGSGYYRVEFIVGISYEDDIEKGKNVIRRVLQESAELIHDDKHPNFVVEDELAASTVNLKVFGWVDASDYRKGALEARGMVMQRVKTSLEAEGFNLPSDITEVKFYGASKPLKIAMQGTSKAIELPSADAAMGRENRSVDDKQSE